MKRYFKGEEIPADDSRLKSAVDNKPANDKLTETTVTLSVPNCSKEDTGEYTLKVKNKYGEAEASVCIDLISLKKIFIYTASMYKYSLLLSGFPESATGSRNSRIQRCRRVCWRVIYLGGHH